MRFIEKIALGAVYAFAIGLIAFCVHLGFEDQAARTKFNQDCRALGGTPVITKAGRDTWACIRWGSVLEFGE